MSTRVYVALTSSTLAELVGSGRLAAPIRAHAVTPTLVGELPGADDEELEYAATYAAADDSWDARTGSDAPRRYVLAADVPAAVPVDDDVTTVRVDSDIAMADVAALHCDVTDLSYDRLEDAELAWFATQEIAEVAQNA